MSLPSNGFHPARSLEAISAAAAWRLAGLLFIGGVPLTALTMLLLDEPVEPWVFPLGAVAVCSGLVCFALSRQPIDDRWLSLVPIVAVVEIALAAQGTDYVLTYLYFLVALYVGLVFPGPREMAPYLALIATALLLRFVYSGDNTQTTALWAIAVGVPLIVTVLAVSRLTSHLETSQETYRALLGVDGLTGAGNYRALIDRLRHEIARHSRKGREFALLSLDLDGFKAVNDTQGHLVGDLILAIVAAMIDLEIRVEDAVYRQGGDEFTVVAPETDRNRAWLLAARIERKVARVTAGPVRVSASVGVAIFPGDGVDPGELLDAADASLRSQRSRLTVSRFSRA